MSTTHKRLYESIRKHSGMERDRVVEAGSHGADTGWPGFTYTSDCVEFYNANEENIYELLRNMADDFGHKNIEELISGFARADMLDTPDGRKNLLAWFALEEVGRWLEGQEEEAGQEEKETETEEAAQ